MGNKLEGKTAVITGGASGIGLATTKRFVLEGAYVFVIDRHKKELDLALSEIGKNVTGIDGDVSNLSDLLFGDPPIVLYYCYFDAFDINEFI
jgi:NAD(P)-dependent dehydrogenase (short-subunit alcohol dehydrogenase family)